MEAALRTAADVLTGEDLPSFEYKAVRGLEGIKQASVTVPLGGVPTELKVVVCSSVKHAGEVLDAVRKGELSCHFIEVMACPGGCIHGRRTIVCLIDGTHEHRSAPCSRKRSVQ